MICLEDYYCTLLVIPYNNISTIILIITPTSFNPKSIIN